LDLRDDFNYPTEKWIDEICEAEKDVLDLKHCYFNYPTQIFLDEIYLTDPDDIKGLEVASMVGRGSQKQNDCENR